MESLKLHFLTNLVNGVIKTKEEILCQAEEANISFNYKYYVINIIELDDYHKLEEIYSPMDLDLYKYAIKNVAEEICSKYGEGNTFSVDNSQIVSIFGMEYNDTSVLKSLVYEIKSSIDSILDFSVTITIGDIFSDIEKIHSSFKECRKRSESKFIIGKDRIIFQEDIKSNGELDIKSSNLEDKLIICIKQMDIQAISELIIEHLKTIPSREVVYEEVYSIISLLIKCMEKNGMNPTDIICNKNMLLKSITSKETIADITEDIKTVICNMFTIMKTTDFTGSSRIIAEVKQVIDENLHEDISLEKVAQKIYMHPMYLSRMFKKETGKNFIDYVTNIRINRAKQLMSDFSLKTYEISEKVGYRSSKHFSKVFKTVTGITPKEYRKNILDYKD